jgi:lipid A 3-O-deacylase
MKTRICLLLIGFVCLLTKAQSQSLRSEVNLTIDNDAFLFSAVDRYYSSGIFATLKRKANRRSALAARLFKKDSTSREHFYYQFAHVFFTPYNPKWTNPDQFDRPYAGWIYLQTGWQGTGKKSVLRLSADLGMVGPATKVQPLQSWWHDVLGFRKPRGWNHQINNSPSLHASLYYLQRLVHHENAEIYWETTNRLGTVLTQSIQGVALRIGELKPVKESVWGGNRLSNSANRHQGMEEFFIFIKESFRYRFYDATVQGNFIGQPSQYTETLEPLLVHHQVGLGMAFNTFDLVMAHNVTSKETPEATFHQYITLDLFFRF